MDRDRRFLRVGKPISTKPDPCEAARARPHSQEKALNNPLPVPPIPFEHLRLRKQTRTCIHNVIRSGDLCIRSKGSLFGHAGLRNQL